MNLQPRWTQAFTAHISVPTKTRDMQPCTYMFDIDGHLYDEHIVGTYELTAQIDGKAEISIQGSFDGRVAEGVTQLVSADRRLPTAEYI